MTAKEMLQKIKDVFNAPAVAPVVPSAPAAPVAPAVLEGGTVNLKGADGSDIVITTKDPNGIPAAGDAVSIGGAPAPQGDIAIEDGSVIYVDASGNIVSITPAASNEPPAAGVSLEQRIATLEKELELLKNPPLTLREEIKPLQAQSEKNTKTIGDLFELIEKILETPTADPVTLTGRKKELFDKAETRAKKLDSIADAIKTLKNKN